MIKCSEYKAGASNIPTYLNKGKLEFVRLQTYQTLLGTRHDQPPSLDVPKPLAS